MATRCLENLSSGENRATWMSVFAFQRNANKRTRMGRLRGLASSSYFLLNHQYSSFSASSPITNTYFEGVNSIKLVVNTDITGTKIRRLTCFPSHPKCT